MSQVLKGSVSGAASQQVMQLGKPVVGLGTKGGSSTPGNNHAGQAAILSSQGQTQPPITHISPTPGMPGVLPGSILTGHNQKAISIVSSGHVTMPTPIVGTGASLNGAGTQHQGMTSGNLHCQTSITSQPQGAQAAPSSPTLANTKEKTPMCLINELARFNKIQHQYTLTDEQGPAHKKIFYVKLKLGDEEYAANGPSIKKAQHAAAGLALECTQYKHPPPKPPKDPKTGNPIPELSSANPSITPTVELNALAMKLGQPAIYRPLEPARTPYYPPPNLNFRGMYNQRYHHPRYPRFFYVSLKVGQREFIGEGNTRQSARHNAADKAIKVLSVLPITEDEMAKSKSEPKGKETPEKIEAGSDGEEEEDPLKSEISLVHEIALKKNMHVNFEVIKESGPPHMKTFVTRCSCGTTTTEGEGNSKKLSKKRAAEKMLEELQQLPSVNTPPAKPKKTNKKKNNRNLIKKADPDYGVGINPISRLIQIQQAKKEKEPIYTLLAEKGMPRRKEFVMQVVVGEQSCTGVGPNKKLAKRNAAEAMLQLLGYSRPAPQPSKSAIKTSDNVASVMSPPSDKKVTFMEEVAHSRQLVPGMLLMPEGSRVLNPPPLYMNTGPMRGTAGQDPLNYSSNARPETYAIKHSPQTTAAIAKELLDTGLSPTAESINMTGGNASVRPQSGVRPKEQLLYLADVLGFQATFQDFPKTAKKQEYVSLVTLSTNPTKVSHGIGQTIEVSHDMAALNTLKALSEMGLDAMTDPSKDGDMAAGDGLHVKAEG